MGVIPFIDCAYSKANDNWNSPIVLVTKKDGSVRFCVDFRYLNSVTLKECSPLPRVDDILDGMNGAKVFSKLDMTSGYWQLPVDEGDRDKLAFSTTTKRYTFCCLPFGVTNAPSHFHKTLYYVLQGIRNVLIYIDDIIIFGTDWEEHNTTLRKVL